MTAAATLEVVEQQIPVLGRPWTEQDYFAMGEAEGLRVELIDGMLIVQSQPDSRHQKIAARLTRELERLLPDHLEALSSVNVRLGPDRVVGPDVVVTRDLSEPKFHEATSVLLVIEVVSPSSRRRDRVDKPSLYAEAKIPWYLIVEREQKLELTLLRRRGMAYTKHAAAGEGDVLDLPDLECSIEVDALLRRR
jgi:Uma2 family endonuclease